MLTNETVSKPYEMYMGTMAGAFSAQLTDSNFGELSFEERFSMLVDAEWSSRKSNRLKRLIHNAGYSISCASMPILCSGSDSSSMQRSGNVLSDSIASAMRLYCFIGVSAQAVHLRYNHTPLPYPQAPCR